jgi:REP element-mobilizing transposase RayT
MPSKKRMYVPGAIAHIMARGIDGIENFKEDADRSCFLNLVGEAIFKTGYLCYGWVLMHNHYHLIVRCNEQPLHRLMRPVNSRYAKYFNKKCRRRGYLFQGRYKSIITQDQGYLEELIRYVHLNPVRAGICRNIKELETYQWCGHSVLTGRKRCSFQTTDTVLRRFGQTDKSARSQYIKFIQDGMKTEDGGRIAKLIRECNRGVERESRPGCWVIGDREFVVAALKKNERRLRIKSTVRDRWSIEKVLKAVADEHNLKSSDLMRRSRLSAVSRCRKTFAYICCDVLGFSVEDVAAFLRISGPAVSWAKEKGRGLVTEKDLVKFINLPPG